MDPITATIAAVGLATSVFGMGESAKSAKKQSRLANKSLTVQNRLAAIEQKAADARYQAERRISSITQQQEAIRQALVNTQAARQVRQSAREEQIARSTAVARAAETGGLTSTGLAGALGSIQGQASEQRQEIFENLSLANRNFSLNRSIFNTSQRLSNQLSGFNRSAAPLQTKLRTLSAKAGNVAASGNMGSSLFSTGISLVNNAQTTSDVFTSLFKGS